MNTYDKRDPLTYCSNCQVEAYGETKPGSHGICGRHAGEVLAEMQRQYPPMSLEEWKAYDRGLKRFKASPDVKEALEAVHTQAELERAARTSRRRRKAIFALEILAGVFCCIVVLVCAWKLTMLLAK